MATGPLEGVSSSAATLGGVKRGEELVSSSESNWPDQVVGGAG